MSEVVPAPNEGPENFELGGESGLTQKTSLWRKRVNSEESVQRQI